MEIYNDAHMFGLKSANSAAVSNSNLAISWLEATFPDLTHQASEGADLSATRARPYALFDASLSLQVKILFCLFYLFNITSLSESYILVIASKVIIFIILL